MKNIDGKKFRELILVSADWVNKNKAFLNRLNVFPVPDGDTGTNMSLTLQGAVEEIKKSDGNLSKIAKAVADSTLMSARGCSGTILSLWFKGFAQYTYGKETINTSDIASAFQEAAKSAYDAVENPVEGTILTVTRECGDEALKTAENEPDVIKLFEKMLLKAQQTLDKTPEMLPILKEVGVVDAGGQGFVFILEAMLSHLNGHKLKSPKANSLQKIFETVNLKKEKLMNKYCVECFIDGGDTKLEQVKDILEKYGGSLIMVKSSGLLKVHIHTNLPKKVLRILSKFGNVTKPKVDNMKKQKKGFLSNVKTSKIFKKKEVGIIAVTLGKGLVKIFRSIGADITIAGRRTMNPSTGDFMKAIKKVKAESYIILPNNSNVLSVANEVKKLSSHFIHVIPTKTIPQGVSSLLAFNKEDDLTANIDNMTKEFKKVKSGLVSYAIDKGKYKQLVFGKGDILGFWENELKVVGKDVDNVTMNLIKNMVKQDDKLISFFYGKKVKSENAKKLAEMIKNKYQNFEVQCYNGGQPHYYYIISVE